MRQLELGSGAELSLGGRLCYRLWVRVGPGERRCLFVLLHAPPDGALSATVRRCSEYAKRWGFDQVRVVALYPHRVSSRRELEEIASADGSAWREKADAVLLEEARQADLVVAAWGVHGARFRQTVRALWMLSAAAVPLRALRVARGGHPQQPLRLPPDLAPQPWPVSKRRSENIPARALSLHQPWAWLLASGIKPIENRRWQPRWRGWFLVHASKTMSAGEYEATRDFASFAIDPVLFPPFEAFALGGVVGAATLTGVSAPAPQSERRTWRMADQYGLECESAEVLPFVACRGGRRWFDLDSKTHGELCSKAGRPAALEEQNHA